MGIQNGRELTSWQLILVLICLALLVGCAPRPASPDELNPPVEGIGAQPYLGMEYPSGIVVRFAPLIFREEMHAPPIFTPAGDEVYFSLMGDPGGVRYMKIDEGVWTDPAPAPFDRLKQGDSPFLTSDGNTLLYLAWDLSNMETIRRVSREDGKWGSPQELPAEVNRNGAHWQASQSDNGNLYFGSQGRIYFSRYEGGSYLPAEDLGLSQEGGYAGSPFIAPDESYLIYDDAGESYADLFITFRNGAGEWDEPIPLEDLNSPAHDLYANVSPDGRFIMFLSSRSGILLPYWVDAGIIDDLRLSQAE